IRPGADSASACPGPNGSWTSSRSIRTWGKAPGSPCANGSKMEIASSLQQVEWAVAQRALPGESVSGDRHVVLPHRRGVTLAVIDGLGHGTEAAKAAELAAATLRRMPENNLLAHLNCCHLALTNSRGVVMTLAEFNLRDHTLTLCGVGNVEATLFRS